MNSNKPINLGPRNTDKMREKLKWLNRAWRWARAGRIDLYRMALEHINTIEMNLKRKV